MLRGNLVIGILDQMQIFDEQVAPARPITEQDSNFVGRAGRDLTAFGRDVGATPAGPRMCEPDHFAAV
jgi:hypothetical protein